MPEVHGVNQIQLDPKHAEIAAQFINALIKTASEGVEGQVAMAMAITYMCDTYDWEPEAVTRCLARNIRTFNTNPELKQAVMSIIAQEVQRDGTFISIPSAEFSKNFKPN